MSGEPPPCPVCGSSTFLTSSRGHRVACSRGEAGSCLIGPVGATPELALAAFALLSGPASPPRRRSVRHDEALSAHDRVAGPEGRLGRVVSIDEAHVEVRWDSSAWATYTYERAGAYRLRRVDEDAER
jgi:hypothetical protein